MNKTKLFYNSFWHALGVLIYTALVTVVLNYGDGKFKEALPFLAPLAILLLFVLSATIVGGLVLGRPVMLYLEGKKAEAVRLLLYTVGWLVIFTAVVLILAII